MRASNIELRRVSFHGGTTAETEVAPTQSPAHGATAVGFAWRAALAIVWPPALVASVYLAVGRLGFYPTDEGLNQAYTYRILLGEVPHRDFISPRPLGSALLHIVDFAIPGPLFEVSRVIAMCEYAAYAILLAWLIYDTVPWRWGALGVIAAAGSVLVNLNSFPLMAWYTVDGLLFVAGGYVAVARGVHRRSWLLVGLGFLLIGAAALTKQSFVPAPAFGWVLLAPWLRVLAWPARFRMLVVTGLVGALPSLAFVAVISLLGGFSALRTQLLGVGFIYGRPLVAAWSPKHDLQALVPLVVAAALLMVAVKVIKNSLLPRVALSVLVIAIPLWARLGLQSNDWGTRVFWVLVAVVVVRSLLARSPDLVGIVLIGAAWMSSLSYGYAWPNLVGGSMVLYVLHRTWSGTSAPGLARPNFQIASIAVALLGLIAVGYVFGVTRQQDVYLDRPSAELTASLSGVAPAFGDIHTNQRTAQYLTQMADCIGRYPARQVAILPENAAIYPALSLRNPFPIDWIWPGDFNGSEARILSVADQLNNEGDYLVLFQTIGEPELVNGSSLPDARIDSPIHTYSPIVPEIYSRLNGRRTTCGTFLVVYSPAADHGG